MILQDIQKHYRYLPREALEMVAEKMDLPIAQIFGCSDVLRFLYSQTQREKPYLCLHRYSVSRPPGQYHP